MWVEPYRGHLVLPLHGGVHRADRCLLSARCKSADIRAGPAEALPSPNALHLPLMNNRRHDIRTPGNDEAANGEADPGAYIGRLPERATETIPGGVGSKDVRVAAVATQPAPVRGTRPVTGDGERPESHREGDEAPDRAREAGQSR